MKDWSKARTIIDHKTKSLAALAKTGNFYQFIRDLTKEYGPDIPLASSLFLVSSLESVKRVMSDSETFEKGDLVDPFKLAAGEGLFTAEGVKYEQQEKIVKTTFSGKNFSTFRNIISEECEKAFVHDFKKAKKNESTVDIIETAVELTMAIAMKAFLGIEVQSQTAKNFRESLVIAQEWFGKDQAANFSLEMLEEMELVGLGNTKFPFLKKWVLRNLTLFGKLEKSIMTWKTEVEGIYPQAMEEVKTMRSICLEIIEERRLEKNSNRDDLLSRLIKLQETGTQAWLTDEAIVDQVVTFFVAGHETTSDLFALLLWLHARGEVPEEIKTELSLAGTDSLSGNVMHELPKTHAYVNKILTKYPPVIFAARKATQETEINGYRIPKGSKLIVSLEMANSRDTVFGYGRRQCVGKNFAIEEAIIGLGYLVKSELVLKNPKQKLEEVLGLTVGYSRSSLPMPASPSLK